MVDFNFVTKRLAVGGAIGGDLPILQAVGVTHIINCQVEFDDGPNLNGTGIKYLHIGVPDDLQPKPVDWFARAINFALPAFNDPKSRVFCHCAAGVSRAPSITYAVLRALGLDTTTAEMLIRRARPQVTIGYKIWADEAIKSLGYDK